MINDICGFSEAWIGPCTNPKPCPKHAGLACVSCGQPATQSCAETSGFVCGAPLCDECDHETAPDGTNGGNFKHCRKANQKHLPWYARESVVINYTNWRGETADRLIVPDKDGVRFGATEYHPEPQWLMDGLDIEKGETRTFALKDVHGWRVATPKDLAEVGARMEERNKVAQQGQGRTS